MIIPCTRVYCVVDTSSCRLPPIGDAGRLLAWAVASPPQRLNGLDFFLSPTSTQYQAQGARTYPRSHPSNLLRAPAIASSIIIITPKEGHFGDEVPAVALGSLGALPQLRLRVHATSNAPKHGANSSKGQSAHPVPPSERDQVRPVRGLSGSNGGLTPGS